MALAGSFFSCLTFCTFWEVVVLPAASAPHVMSHMCEGLGIIPWLQLRIAGRLGEAKRV